VLSRLPNTSWLDLLIIGYLLLVVRLTHSRWHFITMRRHIRCTIWRRIIVRRRSLMTHWIFSVTRLISVDGRWCHQSVAGLVHTHHKLLISLEKSLLALKHLNLKIFLPKPL